MKKIKCPRPGCPGHLVPYKPKQKQLGKTKDQLKMRGRKIAAALLQGKTSKEALQAAGYTEKTAKGQAAAILVNPVIQKGYCEVLEKAGLTDEFAAKTHHALMVATNKLIIGSSEVGDVPDHTVRARGLDMFYKVRGRYVEKKEVSGPGGGPIKIQEVDDEELLRIITGRGSAGTAEAKKGTSKPG
jgi:phosphohistidine swiveling domain-containing protein